MPSEITGASVHPRAVSPILSHHGKTAFTQICFEHPLLRCSLLIPAHSEPVMKALLDFIPLIVFFVLAKQQNIFMATQGLMLSSVLVYGLHFFLQKGKLEKSQWITLVLTIAFGGLTLVLHDDVYLRWKSPVINWIFASAFVISPLIGKPPQPLIQRLLGPVFDLSPQGWFRLNLVWAAFFAALGGLHLLFAFVFPQWWIDFKVMGGTAIMITFIVLNFVALRKHLKQPDQPVS